MSSSKSSVLQTFLGNARARAEAAKAKAAAEAEAQRLAAEAEAQRLAEAQEAEAEAATQRVILALEDATADAEATGGNPAITGLMTGLTDYITSGASGPTQSQYDLAIAEKEAAKNDVDQWKAHTQGLETHVRTANAEKDELQAKLDTAVAERDAANETNLNLQSQASGARRERDQAETRVGELEREIGELERGIKALPKIDLTHRTIGGKVAVPLHVAQDINEGRQFLRNLLGLDPTTPPPATPPSPPAP